MQLSPAYPFPFHQLQPQSSDYELKRRYLALLSPQQIIEICLIFDVHVPPYIKTTIWPVDLNAAIGSMQRRESSQQETNGSTSQPPNDEKKDPLPIMDSLLGPLDEKNGAERTQRSTPVNPKPPQPEPPAPEKSPPPPRPANYTPSETAPTTPPPYPSPVLPAPTTPAPSLPAAPQPQPAASAPPRPPQSGYNHQPYGFAGQSPYQFASYYPQQWGAYPHIRYPFSSGVSFPAPHLQGFPPSVASPVTKAPVVSLPPVPVADANADDLPSYEDMIVEILSGLGEESEGLAPKDLWTWMASRYPVQSNFRPSAGQALQKAFKKGRFEKSESGRYRLNPDWKTEGAPRKGTRRPQVQSGRGTSQGRPPPFTNTPLLRGSPAPSTFTNTSSTNDRPQQMFGYSNYTPPSAARTGPPASGPQSSASGPALEEGTGDVGDVFEAAQHILKAINFGGLLEVNDETETTSVANTDVAVDTSSSLQGGDRDENVRGELQAQLALLVVQLGEILQEDLVGDEREGEIHGDNKTELSRNGVQTVEGTEGKPDIEMEDCDSDADMEFVIV
ncbi:hypothetical protein E1B28_012324 [Marasmius oreades]|uniref:Histone H1 n=1 Tax=Marasmius oreades TaxID=181124 RepID=A0A9P7RR95_9AGAR|nr:uncharacterized protein E1B28_012324 [Marasmius oreades]KAG7088314.1 hypothetical protein E1B28_012324 [Marasmius oreades]